MDLISVKIHISNNIIAPRISAEITDKDYKKIAVEMGQ
jgi:hypothetical protein